MKPAISDNGKAILLSEAAVGKAYVLDGCEGGRHLREKINAMGLNSGALLKIILNPGYGPVGLEVRQTKLGIGRGMAMKIRVKELDPTYADYRLCPGR